ncbi:MAG: zinc ribbon domain-containing protein [Betaproteobacteria bacterium]|nr:zinc ribbon domain-containing protein [Betaproteobacteria bacterium]
MPIFEYQCRQCGNACELLIKGEQVPLCPHCGSEALDKQISLPAAKGKFPAMVKAARSQASREGHFSNYSAAERKKAQ